MPSWRRCAPIISTLLFLVAPDALARGGVASLVVRVTASGGQSAGAVVELAPDTGQGVTRIATIASSSSATVAFHVPPGRYQLRATLAAFSPAEQVIELGD